VVKNVKSWERIAVKWQKNYNALQHEERIWEFSLQSKGQTSELMESVNIEAGILEYYVNVGLGS